MSTQPRCFADYPQLVLSTWQQQHSILASDVPAMTSIPARARSLYRSILRELPQRQLSSPSPVQQRIRTSFASGSQDSARPRLDQAEQYVQYAKAQRMYTTLLERYNPGMSMDEEDKVRLTARRVGMDLPEEVKTGTGS